MSPLWGSIMYVSCGSVSEECGGWRVLTRGERGFIRLSVVVVEEEEVEGADMDQSASPEVRLSACRRPSTDATSTISSKLSVVSEVEVESSVESGELEEG